MYNTCGIWCRLSHIGLVAGGGNTGWKWVTIWQAKKPFVVVPPWSLCRSHTCVCVIPACIEMNLIFYLDSRQIRHLITLIPCCCRNFALHNQSTPYNPDSTSRVACYLGRYMTSLNDWNKNSRNIYGQFLGEIISDITIFLRTPKHPTLHQQQQTNQMVKCNSYRDKWKQIVGKFCLEVYHKYLVIFSFN